jgi:hypothetical protein
MPGDADKSVKNFQALPLEVDSVDWGRRAQRVLAGLSRQDLAELLEQAAYTIGREEIWFDAHVPAVKLSVPEPMFSALRTLPEPELCEVRDALVATEPHLATTTPLPRLLVEWDGTWTSPSGRLEATLRTQASSALVRLYLDGKNPQVSGVALRHALMSSVLTPDGRRRVALLLVPHAAVRTESAGADYFIPTLGAMIEQSPEARNAVDLTLSLLRRKHEQEGDFHCFYPEELHAFSLERSTPLDLNASQLVQVIALAKLGSGWYGTHWGAPRPLEPILDVATAAELAQSRHPLQSPLSTHSASAASSRSDATEARVAPPKSSPIEAGRLPPTSLSKGIAGIQFRVALSFPGPNRPFVARVANALKADLGENAVFYDEDYQAQLARPNLDVLLQEVYRKKSDLVVVFLSEHYQNREWCHLEWRAIREIIKSRQDNTVMLVRLDDSPVDGLFSIDGYIDGQKFTPEEVSQMVVIRLEELH